LICTLPGTWTSTHDQSKGGFSQNFSGIIIYTFATMKLTLAFCAVYLQLAACLAFAPKSIPYKSLLTAKASIVTEDESTKAPLFDPLGLYPESAPERSEGMLQPLESALVNENAVTDPMGLYSDKTELDNVPMSASLPFLKRPIMLDGTVPGDRGFDPFNFSSDKDALQWYRTAEIKHARLAMLAAVGWPLAELFDRKLAFLFGLKPLLVFQDRVPSVLNGGLDRTPAAYWAAALGIAFAIESMAFLKEGSAAKNGSQYTPGDLGFDPVGLAKGISKKERMFLGESEIFNGRLAMLAITGFALQEWWTQNSVINQTPIFFKPINVVLEQLQDAAGNGF
jgi:Chlorophyll A-B binding protein